MSKNNLSIKGEFDDRNGFGLKQRPFTTNATALLLNNTSAHHRFGHFGTNLVNSVIINMLHKEGVSVVAYANTLRGVASVLDYLPELPNLVVLNGEGTLHHNHDRAMSLIMAAAHFGKLGVPCVLVNSIWDQNTSMANSYLELFKYVSVRDSLSAKNISAAGFEANIVPDFSLAADQHLEPIRRSAEGVGIVDTSNHKDSAKLQSFAKLLKAPFYFMDPERRSRHPLPQGRTATLDSIFECSHWITGRFHFALAMITYGYPFLALKTRVNKMQGMMSDAGLDKFLLGDEWLWANSAEKKREIETKFSDWSNDTHESARAYKLSAEEKIASAFVYISELAKEHAQRTGD